MAPYRPRVGPRCETWELQAHRPVTVEALELAQDRDGSRCHGGLENRLPQLSLAFAPSVVGVMLQAFFEAMRD